MQGMQCSAIIIPGEYTLHWTPLQNGVNITSVAVGRGFIGLGWTASPGQMIGSHAVIGWVNDDGSQDVSPLTPSIPMTKLKFLQVPVLPHLPPQGQACCLFICRSSLQTSSRYSLPLKVSQYEMRSCSPNLLLVQAPCMLPHRQPPSKCRSVGSIKEFPHRSSAHVSCTSGVTSVHWCL